ncbi:hypothetical protein NHX12_005150 [Muraenolepis orangiensis]|uniref:Uncharacterized protein n=1 Tax=Muraenolepis orangiensis TaxID=630683 RepID=A0A9Q0IDG5_9TELE|nr:hypothetical protein NHX12_005150 [Muraenolepis orangiensis]
MGRRKMRVWHCAAFGDVKRTLFDGGQSRSAIPRLSPTPPSPPPRQPELCFSVPPHIKATAQSGMYTGATSTEERAWKA